MKRLECAVFNYHWGKKGSDSTVARLMQRRIEEDKFYAELWMGTHPRGESKIKEGEEERIPLTDYFRKHSNVLGRHEKDGLQFLFKVLSVDKSLSVQTHPTKEQAKILNAKDPANYPDANHKPEMAIALTDFELFCGFQKASAIRSNILSHEALVKLIGEQTLSELDEKSGEEDCKVALKKIFTSVWTSPEEQIGEVLKKILAEILSKKDQSQLDKLIVRLNEQFPDDIGIMAPLFLNFFTLRPGEATFLGPNEPHAYLSGDCIECMSLSDNTIRAGLTPKFKDVKTLCENMTYKMGKPPLLEPKNLGSGVVEYAPPISEFSVLKLNNGASAISSLEAASILIVVAGSAVLILDGEKEEEKIQKGDVLFFPLQMGAKIEKHNEEFLAFRAFTPPPNN